MTKEQAPLTVRDKYPKISEWLESQSKQEGYMQLIDYLHEQINGCTNSAMAKGDTDYFKGQAQALVRVRTIILRLDGADKFGSKKES